MLKLKNITLITVTSRNILETIEAMQLSMKHINFGKVIFVSHAKPESLPEDIEFQYCDELDSIKKYSHYMIYNLQNHINTEYCITVQHDGYILRPEKWTDEFFNWDYIGAPWPINPNAYITPFGENIRVGNGGFSFRSKKLLEVPNHINIPFEVNIGNFYKHMNANSFNEDGNICVHNRHLYEYMGCKFAPIEIAAKFSQEIQTYETKNIEPFGFHKFKK
jgi:hypothetical protein